MKAYNDDRIAKFNSKFGKTIFVNRDDYSEVTIVEFKSNQLVSFVLADGTPSSMEILYFFAKYVSKEKYLKRVSLQKNRKINVETANALKAVTSRRTIVDQIIGPVCIKEVVPKGAQPKNGIAEVRRVSRSEAKELVDSGLWHYTSKGAWRKYCNLVRPFTPPPMAGGHGKKGRGYNTSFSHMNVHPDDNRHSRAQTGKKISRGNVIVYHQLVKYIPVPKQEYEANCRAFIAKHPRFKDIPFKDLPVRKKIRVIVSSRTIPYYIPRYEKS